MSADASTRVDASVPASARASVSMPSTRSRRRSASCSAASRSPARRQALEPEPERRQRCPELVRGVRDELALGTQKPRELRDGPVEGDGERPHLRRALPLGRTGIELPFADGGRRFLQATQRPGHEAGEAEPDDCGAREHNDADQREDEPVAANARVDRGVRVRDPHRAVHLAAGGDRHRDKEQPLVERLRVAHAARVLAGEGACDLGPRGEALGRRAPAHSCRPWRSPAGRRSPHEPRFVSRSRPRLRRARSSCPRLGACTASSESAASTIASCETFAVRSRRSVRWFCRPSGTSRLSRTNSVTPR